jgi:hypothetical protein
MPQTEAAARSVATCPRNAVKCDRDRAARALHEARCMQDITELLVLVTGGQTALPLSGNVTQDINTNWGGTQTNIGTQIINPAPQRPSSMIEWRKQNPHLMPYKPRPIRP